MSCSLIIADSNPLIRLGLRTIVINQVGATVVGEACNNTELIEQCRSFPPNVVLIDYTTNGFTIDVIPQVLAENPDIRFVAITFEQSGQTVVNALKAGVTSHIKKDCSLEEISCCIRDTHKGDKFFCGTILETIRMENIDVSQVELGEFDCEPVTLSEREMEIIRHIAEGYTNQQIADRLFLSAHTVNTHRKNIMGKLGVKNTAGIVMYAVKTQIVSPNKFLFQAE